MKIHVNPNFSISKNCLLCQTVGKHQLCSGCLNDVQTLFARPSQQIHTPNAHWSHEWSSANYLPPLPAALQQWKHVGNRAFAALFEHIMLTNPPTWLPEVQIDYLIAMPMSKHRRLERGFNQCDDLVQAISSHYHWHILPQTAITRQHKVAQSTLNRQQRMDNIKNSFKIQTNEIKGKNCLLIDDICTTGATLGELAHSLHQAGAANIMMWTCARKLIGS